MKHSDPSLGTAAATNELLRRAAAAARSGDKRQARRLLKELLELSPDHEQGLLWAAALSDSVDGAFWFLQRLLQVNPDNQQAANILAMHEARLAGREQAQSRVEASRPAAPASVPAATPAAPENPAALDRDTPGGGDRQTRVAAPARPALTRRPTAPPPPKRWRCPICQAEDSLPQQRCMQCHAIVTLADLGAIAANEGLDEKLLTTALAALQRKTSSEPAFDTFATIGLVLLNLKRSAEALQWLKKATQLEPGESLVSNAVQLLLARKLILAVDDSSTVRSVVSLILEQNSYRTITASDGMQALAWLNEVLPDLILLDVSMPRMDGYEVCKIIKKNTYTRSIPVLMLSGNDGFFDKVKGKLAGATDYLTKPLGEDSLLFALDKHLRPAGIRNFLR
jgi:twitching motility two-component system response regulator PilG